MENPFNPENEEGLDRYKFDPYVPNYSCPISKSKWGDVNFKTRHLEESSEEFHPDYYKDI